MTIAILFVSCAAVAWIVWMVLWPPEEPKTDERRVAQGWHDEVYPHEQQGGGGDGACRCGRGACGDRPGWRA